MSGAEAQTTTVTTQPCLMCGKTTTLEVDTEGLKSWLAGALIQDAFPDMPVGKRELLKSGWHAACWARMFGSD